MVGNFKNSLNKALEDKNNKSTKVKTLIDKFLFSYRNAPHSTTGETPSKRMLGREVKTRLSFLRSNKAKEIQENQIKYFHGRRSENFEEGDRVYIRDYKNPSKVAWKKAVIKNKLGNRIYSW